MTSTRTSEIRPVKKAVFPVAGLGTRFLPATKAMPKEMLTVVDRPIIHYAFEEAREAGIEEFIFVTSRGKSVIEDHFDSSFELEYTLKSRGKIEALEELRSWLPREAHVSYVRQNQPLGLGHAVSCARNLVGNEPFAVILADDIFQAERGALAQMIDVYNEVGGNIVSVEDVADEDVSKYGVLDIASDNGLVLEMKGLVEKPALEDAPSRSVVSGRYILQGEIFEELGKNIVGTGGEIQLTDAMVTLMKNQSFHGVRVNAERFDCGKKLGFVEANIAYALTRPDLREDVIAYIKALDI